MKKLFCLLALLSLYGCGSDRQAFSTYQQTARLDNSLTDRYQQTSSATEEYVNRIAKRVALVSDRLGSNVNVRVLATYEPILTLDYDSHTIEISQGALEQLKDEAQLAAALTLGMAHLDNVPNADRETALTLSKAGYDPHAMLELQQKSFYAAQNHQSHWLSTLFPIPPTAGSISANTTMIQKMPKGLQRGQENYSQHIAGEPPSHAMPEFMKPIKENTEDNDNA